MKNKISLFLLILVGFTGCSPNDDNTTSGNLTDFEQQFLGTWFIKRKTINYEPNTNGGIQVETSTDTAHCKVRFKSDDYYNTGFYYCENGLLNCNLTVMGWNAVSPYINFGNQEYQVLNQTNTSLTLKHYDSQSVEEICQLEKNFSDLYTTCSFTYSIQFNDPIPLGYNGDRQYLTYVNDNGITQSVDLTGLTSWSQTVSQTFAQSLHTYNYLIELTGAIAVSVGAGNFATLATVKITDSNGTVVGQVGPKEFCIHEINGTLDCSDGTDPEDDFRIELNCTN